MLMIKLISAKFQASLTTNNSLNHLHMAEIMIITMYKDMKELLTKYTKKIVKELIHINIMINHKSPDMKNININIEDNVFENDY